MKALCISVKKKTKTEAKDPSITSFLKKKRKKKEDINFKKKKIEKKGMHFQKRGKIMKEKYRCMHINKNIYTT